MRMIKSAETGGAALRGQILALLAGVLSTILLGGCASAPLPLRGQVLDAQTGRPVSGAVVLGVWTKLEWNASQASGTLVDVKETEVDDAGRFTLARPDARYARENIVVHKPGYVAWSNYAVFPTYQQRDGTVPPQILLEPFPAGERRLHDRHAEWLDSYARRGLYPKARVPRFIESIGRDGITW